MRVKDLSVILACLFALNSSAYAQDSEANCKIKVEWRYALCVADTVVQFFDCLYQADKESDEALKQLMVSTCNDSFNSAIRNCNLTREAGIKACAPPAEPNPSPTPGRTYWR